MKTVFASYHFKDRSYKGEVVRWLEEAGVQKISVDESDLRPEGSEAVIEMRHVISSNSPHPAGILANATLVFLAYNPLFVTCPSVHSNPNAKSV